MEVRFQIAHVQGRFKLLPGNTGLQSRHQFCSRVDVDHIPHLRFWFPSKLAGHFGGGMNLQTEGLSAIQPFDQNGERMIGRIFRPHDRFSVAGNGLSKRPARIGTGFDDRSGARAIGNFPTFSDPLARGKSAVQLRLQASPAPYPFHMDGPAKNRIGHQPLLDKVLFIEKNLIMLRYCNPLSD